MKQTDSDKYMISSVAEMESVRDEWTEIYQGNSVKPHYLSFEYVMLWYSCFALPDQIRVFRIVDNGMTIGFLPLVINKKFGLKILKSLTNFHCMHSGALVRDGYITTFTKSLYLEMISNRNSWDVFMFEYIYSFDQNNKEFSNYISKNRRLYSMEKTIQTYVTSLSTDYSVYIKSLSNNCRNNIKKYAKRLSRAGHIELVCYQGLEAIDQWPELVRLEDSGWKGDVGSSLKKLDKNYKDYYDGLISILSNFEVLRIYFLKVNGEAIAGGIGYVENDIFHFWKAGFNNKYKELSPSNQLFLFIVKYFISSNLQVSKIHAFTGDFGYKHRYCNEEAYCTELTLYNKTLFGTVACYFNKAKETAKNYALINKAVGQFRKLRSSK